MPDPRDLLPQPPWKGPPIPRGLFSRYLGRPESTNPMMKGRVVPKVLFYDYLTEREEEYRLKSLEEQKAARSSPDQLISDVMALVGHYGKVDIDQETLDWAVENASLKSLPVWAPGAHHTVFIGGWKLGASWDRKLVSREKIRARP